MKSALCYLCRRRRSRTKQRITIERITVEGIFSCFFSGTFRFGPKFGRHATVLSTRIRRKIGRTYRRTFYLNVVRFFTGNGFRVDRSTRHSPESDPFWFVEENVGFFTGKINTTRLPPTPLGFGNARRRPLQ